jgi:Abnormal spindle-like microcephaly-assoc'd, ASPM-SPD-2-Hydin
LTYSQDIGLCEALDNQDRTTNVSFSEFSQLLCCDGNSRARIKHGLTWRSFSLVSLASLSLLLMMTGCTQSLNSSGASSSSLGSLEVSPGAVTFGSVTVGQSASAGVSLINQGSAAIQISSVSITGQAFSVSGAGDMPMTLAAGATYKLGVTFSPTGTGNATGQLTIISNAASSGTITADLSGTGVSSNVAALTSLTCTSGSLIGAGTDRCTVTLNAAAPSGGLAVALTSNNANVSVPGTVEIAAGATSASFAATIAAVASSQSVTLSASVNGVSETFFLQLDAVTPGLNVSSSSLNFGSVAVGSVATQPLTLSSSGTDSVTVDSATVAGAGFSVSGASFPLTLSPGQTAALNVNFDPTIPGSAAGQLTLASNSANGGSMAVSLSGTGTTTSTPVLSGLVCASSSLTGAASDSCTVALNSAAGSGGLTVNLASNNSAISVPSTVTIAAGATSASFIAAVTAVGTTETVTLTASAGGVTETTTLALNAAVQALTASVTSVAFGNVNVNTSSTHQITLTSSGNVPVTISGVTITGSGFSASGISVPQILNPQQSAVVNVQFDPTTTGAMTGVLTVTSNATNGGAIAIALSGSGTIAILPQLSSLTCASTSLTGSATDVCTVTLNGAAPTGGENVNLQSSSTAVTVPATVLVAAGASSATFTATATSVTTATTVTLTATSANSSQAFALQLGASVSTLAVSTTTLSFGNVGVNSTAVQSLVLSSTGTTYVTVSAATVSGSGFSASGATFPLTLSPGQTATLTVQFAPTAAGVDAGSLTLTSNSSTGTSTVIGLSGTGVPLLTGLTCASGSITGAGTDICTVTLNIAAPSGGVAVSLASNNANVTVPASVTVAAGATSASFTANVASVTTAQTASLTASAGGVTESFALQLSASGQLTASPTSLNFGNVTVNSPTTQTVTLSTTSILPITVSLATVTGTGFSLTGSLPLLLSVGQPATFSVQFDPTALGASTGALTILTTSLTNPTTVVTLSGSGVAVSYEVNLGWDAPSVSPDPVAGYNIYRSADGGNTYEELNPSPVTETAYLDQSVQNGSVYIYYVDSVDAVGVQSSPSNMATVTIP